MTSIGNLNATTNITPSCYFYKVPGIVISDTVSCPSGFYCPFLRPDLGNLTLPEVCPTSAECLQARLTSQPCPNINGSYGAQGKYEPVICPRRYYCPTTSTIFPCPKGFFCPSGTVEPHPCDFFSSCPESSVSQKSFTGIILFLFADFILAVLCYRQYRIDNANRARVALESTALDASKDEMVKDQLASNFTKAMNGRRLQLEFKMEHLGYKLPSGREILQDVTGTIKASRLTAIMGPSGAGKTTFLNVLCGKLDKSFGKMLISGREVSLGTFKKIYGFVPQEDVMCREMNVREIILHSARIRSPSSWTEEEIQEHVNVIISTLNLSHVAHSPIGDGIKRGVSGGQRKRVNIAIELAGTPLCLFLDEPTSGLDSTAALEVVDVLRRIAELGMTVASVIHQPRVEIFKKFHDVLLIVPGGKTAYLGPTTVCRAYFEKLGYEFTQGSNEADILMDILSGCGINKFKSYTPDQLVEIWEQGGLRDIGLKAIPEEKEIQDIFQSYDRRTSINSVTSQTSLLNSSNMNANGLDEMQELEFHTYVDQLCKERGASFFMQLYHTFFFSMVQQYRSLQYLALEIGVGAAAGFLMGLSLFDIEEMYVGTLVLPFSLLSSAPAQAMILQFILLVSMSVGLSAASPGVAVFSEEIEVYWRRASSGHSPLAYYSGKILATIPRIVLASLHFAAVLYFLAGLVIPFYLMFTLILLMYFGVYGLCSVVSMIIKRDSATLLALVLSLFSSMFCGYGLRIRDVLNWKLYPIWALQFNYYGAEAFYSSVITFYKDTYSVEFANLGFKYFLDRNALDITMMFLIGIGWRVIAYVCMIRFNQDKQR